MIVVMCQLPFTVVECIAGAFQHKAKCRCVVANKGGYAAGRGLGLESLSLTGCEKVTEKGVGALLKGSAAAQSLTCLDVSRCVGLSGNALDIPPKVCCWYPTSCQAASLTPPGTTGCQQPTRRTTVTIQLKLVVCISQQKSQDAMQ